MIRPIQSIQEEVNRGDLVLLMTSKGSKIPLFYDGPASFLSHSDQADLRFADVDSPEAPSHSRLYTLDLSSMVLSNSSEIDQVVSYEVVQKANSSSSSHSTSANLKSADRFDFI